MKETLHKILLQLKPGVSRQSHLFMAAFLWTATGCGLMFRGILWLAARDELVLIFPALVLGTIKSRFILDKTAKKSIDRIQRLADGSCLGAVYSLKTWAVVLLMILFGYLLRNASISLVVTGGLYSSIGWSLIFSSRCGWIAWSKTR